MSKDYNTDPTKYNQEKFNTYSRMEGKDIFDSNLGMSRVGVRLAQNRFDTFPNSNPVKLHSIDLGYHNNGAALEVYNYENPLLLPRYLHALMSIPIRSNNVKTKNGHSEKLLMIDALNQIIEEENREIDPPLMHAGSSTNSNNKTSEMVKYIRDNAPKYKQYLNANKYRLNLLSELPICTSGDNNCFNFMERLAPNGSILGDIAADRADPVEARIRNTVENKLEPAYRAFLEAKNNSPSTTNSSITNFPLFPSERLLAQTPNSNNLGNTTNNEDWIGQYDKGDSSINQNNSNYSFLYPPPDSRGVPRGDRDYGNLINISNAAAKKRSNLNTSNYSPRGNINNSALISYPDPVPFRGTLATRSNGLQEPIRPEFGMPTNEVDTTTNTVNTLNAKPLRKRLGTTRRLNGW